MSDEGVASLVADMQPLDVIFEKTPFRATDKFIPGHYGHAAIWVGNEQQLKDLRDQAVSKHDLEDVLVVHRVGTVHPGDDIVLVAAFSAHRKAALDACREMMEILKSTAPFWKKETLTQGERWVEKNTPG